jgi:L-ribulose-5-phosphate 3-epimerase
VKLGVKQGRLRATTTMKREEFPLTSWREEFFDARKLGLSRIEWLVGYEDVITNPLLLEENLDEIWDIQKETGITVESATLDYLVESPMHKENYRSGKRASWEIISFLLHGLSRAGIKIAVVPLVAESGNEDESSLNSLRSLLPKLNEIATQAEIQIALECELSSQKIRTLVESSHDLCNVGFNFDTGNSASLGNDPKEEIHMYGEKLINVHLKDRKLKGVSVPLGKGDVDFAHVISLLRSSGYSRNAILEGARSKSGQNYEQIHDYIRFLEQIGW